MPGPPEAEIVDLTSDNELDNAQPPVPGLRHDKIAKPALSPVALQQLYMAIQTCPEAKLRDILVNMVADDAVSHALFTRLVVEKPPSCLETDAEHEHAGGAQEMALRWATCSRCDEIFDVAEEREEGECVYHTGECEVQEDEFADHDERVHGPMDTFENRRDFPEGFSWTCCESDGGSLGCIEGTHVSEVSKKRRTRY